MNGSSISGSPFVAGHHPSATVIDASGRFLFVASKGADALALDVTGSYLFVAGHDANEVVVFRIDGEGGTPTLLGRTALQAAGPSSLVVDPSGQYLYVTSDKTGGVTTLNLDVFSGTLTRGADARSPGRASSIVVASRAATAQAR